MFHFLLPTFTIIGLNSFWKLKIVPYYRIVDTKSATTYLTFNKHITIQWESKTYWHSLKLQPSPHNTARSLGPLELDPRQQNKATWYFSQIYSSCTILISTEFLWLRSLWFLGSLSLLYRTDDPKIHRFVGGLIFLSTKTKTKVFVFFLWLFTVKEKRQEHKVVNHIEHQNFKI